MSDELEPVVEPATEPVGLTVDEVLAEKDLLAKQLETLSKEKSGVDRSVGEMQKQLKQLQQEKLSEAERSELQRKEEHASLISQVRDLQAEKLGLPDEMKTLLTGDSVDEIKAQSDAIKVFREAVGAEFKAKIEELEGQLKVNALKTPTPKGGPGEPQNDLEKRLQDALALGGTAGIALASQIKREQIKALQE